MLAHFLGLFRLIRTTMAGWRKYRNDPDPRVRKRMDADGRRLRNGAGAALWAMEKYLARTNPVVSQRIRELRLDIERELGGFSKMIGKLAGPVLWWSSKRDATRFPSGRPLEPRTFVERR